MMFCLRRETGLLFLRSFIFFLVFLFFSSSLFAQKPWYVFLDLSSEYNDNIYWTEKNEDDDLVNRVWLGGGVKLMREHKGIDFTYATGFEFYSKNSKENTNTHNLQLNSFLTPIQNLTLRLRDYFVHSKDMSEIDEYGVRRSRQNYWKNELSPSFEYTFGKNRILNCAYHFNKTRFSGDSSQNSTEHRVDTKVNYEISIRHSISMDYSFTYGELSSDWGYLKRHTLGGAYYYRFTPHTQIYISNTNTFSNYTKNRDSKTYTVVSGLNHSFSKRLSCDLNGGIYFYKLDNRRTTKSFSGTFSLDYLYERSKLSFKLTRGVREILFTTDNLGLNTYWSAVAVFTHQLTPYLDVSASIGYSESNFSYTSREDKFWNTSFTLNYSPLKWLKAYFSYKYNKLDTTEDLSGYEVNRIMIGLKFIY